MAGLFDTLGIGTRSLATYRQAIDVAGHNIANVNTEGYTRQRLVIEAITTGSEIGEVGAGSEGVRVVRLHDVFIDRQILTENSVQGSLEAKQSALEQALASLNETLSRGSGTSTGGISQSLSDFFNTLQNLSTTPLSIPDRQVALQKAIELTTRFNQADTRLADLESSLNARLQSDVDSANALLEGIAALNKKISLSESFADSEANDLRDARQLKIDQLSSLMKFDTAENENGAVNIIVNGQTLVDGANVISPLETFDSGSGKLMVRLAGDSAPFALNGGSIEGTISVRDNQVATLRSQINDLAATLIAEVNQVHSAGFGLDGSTGTNFFTGTNASDIKVNADLLGNPQKMAISGVSGASGDSSNLLRILELSSKAHASLNGLTFSDRQAQIVSSLGQELASANRDLADQKTIQDYLGAQRDSISRVSIDEEMANLVMFQKAFQASAKLISVTDEMLATIIQM